MRKYDIRAKSSKRFKVTTDSTHDLPMAANLLNPQFTATEPSEVWAGDITCIPTTKAGCTWPWRSTCAADRWWAGRCMRT